MALCRVPCNSRVFRIFVLAIVDGTLRAEGLHLPQVQKAERAISKEYNIKIKGM